MFRCAFVAPFTNPFSQERIPWWLAGGINSANAIAAYQPKGALSLASSYTNLANPGTYNAAPGTAPTWDVVNGWIFGGTTQLLTTGIVVATGWSAICRFFIINRQSSSNPRLFDDTSSFSITISDVNVGYTNGGLTGHVPTITDNTEAVLGIAGQAAYRNGIYDGLITTGSMSGNAIVIGNRAAANRGFNGYIKALAFYNTILTAAQVLAVTNAMNVL